MTDRIDDVLLAISKLGDDLRGEMSQLRIDVMARLDRHEDRLSAIQEDIGVNFGRADRAVDAVKSLRATVDHLSEELSIVTRQMRRMRTELDDLKTQEPS